MRRLLAALLTSLLLGAGLAQVDVGKLETMQAQIFHYLETVREHGDLESWRQYIEEYLEVMADITIRLVVEIDRLLGRVDELEHQVERLLEELGRD